MFSKKKSVFTYDVHKNADCQSGGISPSIMFCYFPQRILRKTELIATMLSKCTNVWAGRQQHQEWRKSTWEEIWAWSQIQIKCFPLLKGRANLLRTWERFSVLPANTPPYVNTLVLLLWFLSLPVVMILSTSKCDHCELSASNQVSLNLLLYPVISSE